MFTGLVDDVGTIERVTQTSEGLELRIGSRYDDLVDGESVAVNGVCLTVRESGENWFSVSAVGPTVDRTTIGEWTKGRRVNLERSLRAGDRMGGHIVQGHVDGVGSVVRSLEEGDALLLDIGLPPDLAELAVPRGSIAVDGVSLTIQTMPAADIVRLAIIDFTRRHTTLGTLVAGSRVHIESDIIGKYVQRLLLGYAKS